MYRGLLPVPATQDQPAPNRVNSLRLPPVSGTWFAEFTSFSQAAMTANRLYYMPVLLAAPTAIDRIAMIVATAQAGALAKVGVYSANPVSRLPQNFIAENNADLDLSSTGQKDGIFGVNPVLPAGLSWLAVVSNNSVVQARSTAAELAAFCFRNSINIGSTRLGITQMNLGETVTYSSGNQFFPMVANATVAEFANAPVLAARAY